MFLGDTDLRALGDGDLLILGEADRLGLGDADLFNMRDCALSAPIEMDRRGFGDMDLLFFREVERRLDGVRDLLVEERLGVADLEMEFLPRESERLEKSRLLRSSR